MKQIFLAPLFGTVVHGLTKAQACAMVGTPMRAATGEDGGKPVEIWFPPQETGASGSYGSVLGASTGFPANCGSWTANWQSSTRQPSR
jgi:hypothetical protein